MEKVLEKYGSEEFEKWIEQTFMQIHDAWNQNKPENLVNIESNLLYERDAEKMRQYKNKGLREVRKCVVINYVQIIDHNINDVKEVLKVRIKASMENYIYDIHTGEITEGIRDYKKTDIYELILSTKKAGNKIEQIKCNGCGADIEMNANGKCEYCGNLYYTEKYDWLIEDMYVVASGEEEIKKSNNIFDD